jgi:hypothetical protein
LDREIMNSIARAARTHMLKMEARIEQQAALIVKLKADGRDVAEPTRTLALLRKALEDIQFQLGRLMPGMELRAGGQSSDTPAQ